MKGKKICETRVARKARKFATLPHTDNTVITEIQTLFHSRSNPLLNCRNDLTIIKDSVYLIQERVRHLPGYCP